MEKINYKPDLLKVGLFRLLALILSLFFAYNILLVLQPSEYADFVLIFSLIQFITVSFLSWPNQYLLNYGRKSLDKHGNINAIFTTRGLVHLILLTLVIILIILVSPFLSKVLNLDVMILKYSLIFGVLIMPLVDIFTVCAQVYGKFFSYSISPVIQRIFQIAALLFLYYNFFQEWILLIIFTLIGYFVSILLLLVEVSKNKIFSFEIKKKEFVNLLKYSSFIPLSALAMLLFNWIDVWIIRLFLDQGVSGIFAWSYSFVMIANGFFTSLAVVIAPKVIDFTQKNNHQQRNKYFYTVISVCLFFNIFLPIFLVFFSMILNSFLPNAYADAQIIILILFNSFSFQFIKSFFEPAVYAEKKLVENYSMILVKTLIIKIIIILFIINNMSFMYVSLATFFSYFYLVVKQHKLLGSKLFDSLNPCLLSIIILNLFSLMFIISFSFGDNWAKYLILIFYFIFIIILFRMRQFHYFPKSFLINQRNRVFR